MNEPENDEELREYSLQREVWGSTRSRILYTYVICYLHLSILLDPL
ncbi:hypothetical protein Hanom_Chr14g01286051 [Helianthus anomalus]